MKVSSKSVLREIFKNKIDESVRINKKISIQSPQNVWFKELGLKEYFSELINSESFKNRGIFHHKKVNMYWNEYLNEKKDTSFLLWQILNTEEWFRVFIDNKPNKKFIFEY